MFVQHACRSVLDTLRIDECHVKMTAISLWHVFQHGAFYAHVYRSLGL